MKKTIFFAAALLLAVGCQKSELIEKVQEQNMITHTFSVDEEDTKSLFDPNSSSIKLDKKESIAVGWAPVGANGAKINGIVEAKRSDGKFSFSHTAVDSTNVFNYFFVMPYRGTSNININSKGASMYVKIDGVQHPTATSFDPLQDYILGQPVLNATEQKTELSSSDLKLKRLFSPLRVTLRDEKNVFGGEPLMSVSIGFPLTTEADKKNNLATLVYLKSTETDENGNTVVADFANAGPSGYAKVDTDHVSPTVTAEYADGLAIDNGTYTVWYVTLPVEKAAGTELTVVAQSKNKKVTRKIALPKAMKLKAGIINDLKINITGEGYDVEDTADPNDYWSIYNAGQDITVGGQVINKANHPDGVLLEGDTATKANLQKGGLIFLGSNVNLTDHLKFGGTDYKNPKETILIGRKKDVQPKISLEGSRSLYFENGNTIIKNIDITSGTASQLFVTTKTIEADIDYAIIEDCNITASKHVYVFNVATPVNVVKSISFDNCVINLAGTDNSYTVCRMGASNDETITASGYAKFESVSINNCIIYANTVHTNVKLRRMLVDYGSNSNSVNASTGVRSNYLFPTENLNITVTNNTIVNLNANSNIFVRAYEANSANINKNVIYTDLTPAVGKYSVTYLFGLYKKLEEGTHDYKIRDNYSYVKRSTEDPNTGDAFKWKYTSAGPHDTYSVGDNIAVNNATELPITIGTTPGYFPINTAVVTNGAGASYDTKPWVKVK